MDFIFNEIKDKDLTNNIDIIIYDPINNSEDKQYIKNNKTFIYNFFLETYRGDFKGCTSRSDLVKKTYILKVTLYNNDIVAMSIYNNYMGGIKCVGIGATRKTEYLHKIGILGVRKILKQDFNIPDDGYWIEASGKIEEICNETNAISVPAKFADIIIPMKKHKIIDEYHYQALFGNDLHIKKMFGVKDKKTSQMIHNYYKEREKFLNELINNEPISESFKYTRFKTSEEKYKAIVDYFIMLVNEEHLYEFTPYMLKQFKNALLELKKIVINKKSNNLRNIRISYSEGCKLLKYITKTNIIK